jgi:hypothetical protein
MGGSMFWNTAPDGSAKMLMPVLPELILLPATGLQELTAWLLKEKADCCHLRYRHQWMRLTPRKSH